MRTHTWIKALGAAASVTGSSRVEGREECVCLCVCERGNGLHSLFLIIGVFKTIRRFQSADLWDYGMLFCNDVDQVLFFPA